MAESWVRGEEVLSPPWAPVLPASGAVDAGLEGTSTGVACALLRTQGYAVRQRVAKAKRSVVDLKKSINLT